MTAEALGNLLAPVNAGLNLTSTLFLLAGYRFIRRKEIGPHRRAMTGAVVSSALFLVFYLLRYSLTGTHRFAGEGLARAAYLGILYSHMFLAALVAPLVARLLYLVWTSRFEDHARWARWTLPIWLYVSITGLAVYLLLYHLYGYL
jgi:putative membrane protein